MVNENSSRIFKLGVIRGAGTGNRLVEIFTGFLKSLVQEENKRRPEGRTIRIEFEEDEKRGKDESEKYYIYHSFQSLIREVQSTKESSYKILSERDAERLKGVCKDWFEKGVRIIFRTSINAEALYLFRRDMKAVKELTFATPLGGKVLVVRDEAEGFYTNEEYRLGAGEVTFSGKYTREHQQRVTEHALTTAGDFFTRMEIQAREAEIRQLQAINPNGRLQHQSRLEELKVEIQLLKAGKKLPEFKQLAIYKFHLFGNFLERWIKEKSPGIAATQPDNGLTTLIQFINTGQLFQKEAKNVLVICSNEVGDLIHESLLSSSNITSNSAKIELYTKNVYLAKPFYGRLKAYQTVHGSADDLEDDPQKREQLNPIATFRIAADIAENELGISNVRQKMEEAIVGVKIAGLNSTTDIIASIRDFFDLKEKHQKVEYEPNN